MRGFLVSLLLILIFSANGQVILRGVVINSVDKRPLPYANIYLSDDIKTGTTSDSEGLFVFMIPNGHLSVSVSYLGFSNEVIKIDDFARNDTLIVQMIEDKKILEEVVVTSKDTIKSLLRKAFDKILSNYPENNILVNGFYREVSTTIPEHKFLYFSESELQFFEASYGNTKFGPVKIIDGGKIELNARTTYSTVFFYGGPYIAQRLNFVKQREEFINPRYLHLYDYSLTGETSIDGNNLYIIEFSPLAKAKYKGVLFIDKITLAYVECRFSLSDYGLKVRNQASLSGFDFSKRDFLVKYKQDGSKWHLHVAVQDGQGGKSKQSNVRYTNEYVSTYYEALDSNPIKDSEAIPYSGIYTSANQFNDKFWNRREVMVRPKQIQNEILLYANESHESIKEKTESENKVRVTPQKKWREIVSKISTGSSVGLFPVSMARHSYNVSYKNNFSISKSVLQKDLLIVTGTEISYNSSKWIFSLNYITDLESNLDFFNVGLKFKYNKHIAGWKKPFFVQPSIGFYYAELTRSLGVSELKDPFGQNGGKINSEKIEIGIGERRRGVVPSLQFVYKIKPVISLYVEVGASLYSVGKDLISIKEKGGFFLARNSLNLDANTEGIQISDSSLSLTSNDIRIKNLYPFTFFGIRIGR